MLKETGLVRVVYGVKIEWPMSLFPTVLNMYAKCGRINSARQVFDEMSERNLVSWSAMISGYDQAGGKDGKFMLNHSSPDTHLYHLFQTPLSQYHFTFVGLLRSCADSNALHRGMTLHCRTIKHRLDSSTFIDSCSSDKTRLNPDVGVDNALTNMYAKCGSIAYAYNVFNRMPCRNLVTWNTIIAAFGNHGLGSRALEHFEQLRADGLEPDCVTFVGLLMACNHAGMVDEGLLVFDCMQETYGIAPDIEHFSCLIDMLGRAGRLNKAEDYTGRFALGKMRWYEMWDGVAEGRKKMKGSGLKKEAGYSMVQVKGGYENFTVGDFSHSRIDDMLDALTTLALQGDRISLHHRTT
ncbi:hypothetical protein F3Y22_tig00110204pilonHSYRG00039 [Hibiscus syriacus]|uniref:Pentatricopeptide repeat-containing protein n=1 Tax=Hibiscus syriacus TaxID=106335 RepID=A0A6A3BA96_HIBSY|nr:hypothetical protein F3Y22_tig00110204pilonHSYRG00039 [Hibiscus syriacus]